MRNRVASALKMWNPMGRTVPAPVSPKLNLSSSVAKTLRQLASYTSAQWPALFSADAHAARFGSSGNGSDCKRSVTRHSLPLSLSPCHALRLLAPRVPQDVHPERRARTAPDRRQGGVRGCGSAGCDEDVPFANENAGAAIVREDLIATDREGAEGAAAKNS